MMGIGGRGGGGRHRTGDLTRVLTVRPLPRLLGLELGTHTVAGDGWSEWQRGRCVVWTTLTKLAWALHALESIPTALVSHGMYARLKVILEGKFPLSLCPRPAFFFLLSLTPHPPTLPPHLAERLGRLPREGKILGLNPAFVGIFFGVESYLWLKNWHFSGHPARRLVLKGQCWDWLARCQYTVTGWDGKFGLQCGST